MKSSSVIGISGGTGFIGKHLLEGVLRKGYSVIAVHRRSSEKDLLKHDNLLWAHVDEMENISKWKNLNAFVHLATNYGYSASEAEVYESNVLLPLRLLQLLNGTNCQLFINTDSYFSKDINDYKYLKEYSKTKRAFLEKSKTLYESNSNLRFVNARLEHVYGPGDSGLKFVPYVLNTLIKGEELNLTPGEQMRDFIFIKDIVEFYLKILEKYEDLITGYTELQIGTGIAISIRDFVEEAKKISNSKSSVSYGFFPYRENEIMVTFANEESLKSLSELGWEANTTLQEGLNQTVDDIRSKSNDHYSSSG